MQQRSPVYSTSNLPSLQPQDSHVSHVNVDADCLSCRLTGAGALSATALYMLYQAQMKPGTKNVRIFTRVFATGKY